MDDYRPEDNACNLGDEVILKVSIGNILHIGIVNGLEAV